MEIPEMKLEGTPEEVAAQVFQKIIAPMFEELKKTDPASALNFGYCIAGNAIGCYLSSVLDVSKAEVLINKTTKSMATDIKRHKINVC